MGTHITLTLLTQRRQELEAEFQKGTQLIANTQRGLQNISGALLLCDELIKSLTPPKE